MSRSTCHEEVKEGRRRLEGRLKYEGNESLSLQLDHKWHHCHHLVLISFHLSAPPLQAISGYWVTGGPPLIIFMGTQGQTVLRGDERIFIWMHIMLCSQYSGTFSAYLRIASEAFSSTESLISEGFMCFILPPRQLGPHAWWAGYYTRGCTVLFHGPIHNVNSARTAVQRLSLCLNKGQAGGQKRP